MTTESRQLVDLEEVEYLQFDCKNTACRAKILIPVLGSLELPSVCPLCKTNWVPRVPNKAWNALVELRKSWAVFTDHASELEVTVTMQLESSD